MTHVTNVSFTPYKLYSMKRIIITLTDCETGEIFAGTRKDVPKDGKTAQLLLKSGSNALCVVCLKERICLAL